MSKFKNDVRTLKDMRGFLGMTQTEFAEHVDLTREHVAAMESGRIGISDTTAGKLALHFDITDDYIKYIESKRHIERLING